MTPNKPFLEVLYAEMTKLLLPLSVFPSLLEGFGWPPLEPQGKSTH